jgi:hypothetical protein
VFMASKVTAIAQGACSLVSAGLCVMAFAYPHPHSLLPWLAGGFSLFFGFMVIVTLRRSNP